jgi:predicted NAD/FAD-dependent oxidoreductase
MFQHRSKDFDPRISAIARHLRAIEKELGGIGQSAGRRASTRASEAGAQIADAIGPILNEIVHRFGRGQRVAVDEPANWVTRHSKSEAELAAMRWTKSPLRLKIAPWLHLQSPSVSEF